MKVYVLFQEWNSPYEGREHNIIGVYDTSEKACKILESLYKQDKEWVQEEVPAGEEFDEDIFDSRYSFIQYDECWSCNTIYEFKVE